jgi:hypothetical protein
VADATAGGAEVAFADEAVAGAEVAVEAATGVTVAVGVGVGVADVPHAASAHAPAANPTPLKMRFMTSSWFSCRLRDGDGADLQHRARRLSGERSTRPRRDTPKWDRSPESNPGERHTSRTCPTRIAVRQERLAQRIAVRPDLRILECPFETVPLVEAA